MSEVDLKELRSLADRVIYASTKKDAAIPLKQFQFQADQLRGEIDPYLFGKLQQAVGYANEASGNVKNKQHWINSFEQQWYVFENGMKTN